MKLRSFITNKTPRRKGAKAQRFFYKFFFASLRLCAFALILSFPVLAQKLAVLVPEKTAQSEKFAEKLEDSLAAKLKILDRSLSETAFNAENYANPFNLSTEESKIAGARLGCDYFLLIKAANQRRSTFAKADFFESYAAVYVVSARTGRLVFWKLNSFEDEKEAKAEDKLLASTDELASEIFEKLKIVGKDELNENRSSRIEELPDENSSEAKNLRPPLPYKRIKPEYTRLASLYFVEATVDIEIEVGADGKILKTEIVRWAGFGLDESVTDTIRRMQWRAADRNGKPLPMRVLLRYNFKKPEKE
jgi:Gram-negative bacterial TonB protein C-terminal